MTPLISLESAAARLFGDVRTREALLLITRGGAIVYASPACVRLLGVRPRALRGRQWQSLLHPQEPSPLLELGNVGPRGLRRNQRLIHPHAGDLWVEVSARAVRPDSTHATRGAELVLLLHDVSARHIAESAQGVALAALERSRAELNESQRMAHLGTWRWEIESNVVEWSDELHAVYGVPVGTPLTLETFLTATHPEDRRLTKATIERAVRTGRPYSITHRAVRPDGTERVLEGHGRAELNFKGETVRILGTCQDVTALVQAREVALSASRLKSEFLASMGQQMRTPMNGVVGMLELLMDTPLSREQAQFCVGIRACCDGLLLTVNGLFDLARMEAGRLVLHMDDFDLHAMPGANHGGVAAPSATERSAAAVEHRSSGVPQRAR